MKPLSLAVSLLACTAAAQKVITTTFRTIIIRPGFPTIIRPTRITLTQTFRTITIRPDPTIINPPDGPEPILPSVITKTSRRTITLEPPMTKTITKAPTTRRTITLPTTTTTKIIKPWPPVTSCCCRCNPHTRRDLSQRQLDDIDIACPLPKPAICAITDMKCLDVVCLDEA